MKHNIYIWLHACSATVRLLHLWAAEAAVSLRTMVTFWTWSSCETEFPVKKLFYNDIYIDVLFLWLDSERRLSRWLPNTSTFVPNDRSQRTYCVLPIMRCAFGAHLDVGLAERPTPCRFIETVHVFFDRSREDGRLWLEGIASDSMKYEWHDCEWHDAYIWHDELIYMSHVIHYSHEMTDSFSHRERLIHIPDVTHSNAGRLFLSFCRKGNSSLQTWILFLQTLVFLEWSIRERSKHQRMFCDVTHMTPSFRCE